MATMSEDTFFSAFKPVESPGSEGSHQWSREELVASAYWATDGRVVPEPQIRHLWTIVEVDEGQYLIPGLHVVNFIGYVITEVPWVTGDEEAVWWLESDMGD